MSDSRELYRSPNGDSWYLGREPQNVECTDQIHFDHAAEGGQIANALSAENPCRAKHTGASNGAADRAESLPRRYERAADRGLVGYIGLAEDERLAAFFK